MIPIPQKAIDLLGQPLWGEEPAIIRPGLLHLPVYFDNHVIMELQHFLDLIHFKVKVKIQLWWGVLILLG